MRAMNKALWVSFLFALGLGTTARADAQQADALVPHLIPIQGLLTDPEGVPMEGDHDVSVALFKVADGGTALAQERHDGVGFDHGQFTVLLGSETEGGVAFSGLVNIPQLWLEVSVDNELLKPRVRLGSVPYAAAAELCGDARTLAGHPATEFATTTHTHAWGDITGVPAAIKDGTDADTLGGLSCPDAGSVARFDGVKWTCSTLSASDITGGTLATGTYSAYADLQAENRVGIASDTSLLTRGAADARYMFNDATFPVNPSYQSLSASNGATTTTGLTGRFCALSSVQTPGAGSCAVTGTGPFVLTAVAGPTQTTNCTASCF